MSLVTLNENSTYTQNDSFGGDQYFTNKTNSSGVSDPYPSGEPVLEVENNGSAAADVGVKYGYGDDATANPLDKGKIHTLFQFIDQAGNRISPEPGSDTEDPEYYTKVGAGSVEYIGLELNYSDSLAQDIAEAAGFSGSFGNTENANADLLNIVEFGVDDGA